MLKNFDVVLHLLLNMLKSVLYVQTILKLTKKGKRLCLSTERSQDNNSEWDYAYINVLSNLCANALQDTGIPMNVSIKLQLNLLIKHVEGIT